jgi:hypothetical protein
MIDYIPNKIGCAIMTFNSEDYFAKLFDSIDRGQIDELVVINGGKPYDREYDRCHWIQHTENKYPSVCRNEAVERLVELGCEHIFLIEDDMIILDNTIFAKYIEASKRTGLKYIWYVSTSEGSGERGKRTPRITVDYPNNLRIAFYQNMCNEFTYHHVSVIGALSTDGEHRPYDENMRNGFDVEMTYRESLMPHSPPFRWFPDIVDSDSYITNNPEALSRLQANGDRANTIAKEWAHFESKHKVAIVDVGSGTEHVLRTKLKMIYENRVLPEYDVFIPCAPKDFLKLPYVLDACQKYTKASNVFVCCPEVTKEIMESLPKFDFPVQFVLDENVFPYDKSKIGFRPNWTYQQFLKMFQTVTPSEWFLTIDADTILLNKLDVFGNNDKPNWFYGWDQMHQPYFSVMTDLDVEKVVEHTCIGDVGFFNKTYVADLLKHTRCSTPQKLLEMIGGSFTPEYHFSEFETYANFVQQTNPNTYNFERLTQRVLGRWLDAGEDNWRKPQIEYAISDAWGKWDVLNLHSWKV